MADEEKDKLLDHDADGIQEYDNDLPRWWLYGFYFTIVMSVIYMFYYHVYGGPDWNFLWYGEKSQELEYVAEVEAAEQMKASIPTGPKMEMKLLTDQASLDAGKEIYLGKGICHTCHQADGGGQVGPNLTDRYWIHGCSIEEVAANIASGFPDKGMIPYGSGTPLSDLELMQVASFIISLQGSTPAAPKEIDPEREVPCPPVAKEDS
jgi:cytochrome c oxidase cbb3-type subunit III